MNYKKKLYLIVDAKKSFSLIFSQIKEAINGGVSILQIYNPDYWQENNIREVQLYCKSKNVSVFFYENLELAQKLNLDGVHLEEIPDNFDKIKSKNSKDFKFGLTVSNDLDKIEKAVNLGVNYLSFCSVFPTSFTDNCEIVDMKNIKSTLKKYNIPIYLAGGITKEKLEEFSDLNIAGIVMISGLLNSKNIKAEAEEILKKLNP